MNKAMRNAAHVRTGTHPTQPTMLAMAMSASTRPHSQPIAKSTQPMRVLALAVARYSLRATEPLRRSAVSFAQ